MRVLIAPLSMPLLTMGPAGRTVTLAAEGVRRGHDVAACAARDGNLRPEALPAAARWLPAPLPSLLGLPRVPSRQLLALMQHIGMSHRAKVASFEQVLFLGGHLRLGFFQRDVEALRRAIREFKPDVFFSEYRLEAMAAARLERVPVCGTHSFPGRAGFAASPKLSRAVRGWLKEQGLGDLDSVLSLYEEQNPRFVASSPSLEPFPEEVVYVGPLTPHPMKPAAADAARPGDAIVAYLGNGALPTKVLVDTLSTATKDDRRQVYIAAGRREERPHPNLHLAPRFDFSKLLPRAQVFINHGGQNSIMDGLLAGVPQLMIPGKVFERNYNADSVVRLGAGRKLTADEFTPRNLNQALEELAASGAADKARRAGEELASLGGAAKVFDVLEERFGR